ncbi:MAG TPA: HD-GYP domain-containing protein [Terriglobales bacterium]|nr:HD-GYP domain-containing protein [Terriglobales bacterium]
MAADLPAVGASFMDAVACAMGALVDLRDLGTGVHSTQIVELAIAVGAHFGWETQQLRELEISATLHDIGKIGIPDNILNKQQGLDAAEAAIMRRHPEYGWAILRQVPGFEWIALFILHHHERWDGSGYPGKLRGREIPLGARILAVVDAFHAMTSDRPYRRGVSIPEACNRLTQSAGTQFDPEVVAVFVDYARQQFLPAAHAATAAAGAA